MEWFLETDQAFRQLSLKVSEEERSEKSYIYWTTVYTQKHALLKSLNLFHQALVRDLENMLKDGILECRRTNQDAFTTAQKIKLFYLQNRKLRSGQEVSILDLYTGNLEADHMISVKDGGDTTIENGELMTVYENRRKGATSNQPYFKHQRGQ